MGAASLSGANKAYKCRAQQLSCSGGALAGRQANEGHSKGLIKYSNFTARRELLCAEKVEASELGLLSPATIAWSTGPPRGYGGGRGTEREQLLLLFFIQGK